LVACSRHHFSRLTDNSGIRQAVVPKFVIPAIAGYFTFSMEESKIKTILDAARKRFAHYGLSKTTLNDIAADIGMSKASLYYYFPDKERIFVAVVEQDVAEFVSVIEDLIERPSKASFKLKKYVALRNDLLVRLLNLGKVENPKPADLFNPVFDELKMIFSKKEKGLIARILQFGIDTKEFQKFDVDTYSTLLLSVLSGLRTASLTSNLQQADHEKVNQQAVLFVNILLKSIDR
jgi:TetR/AcrR family transcriptional repressor of mexJK operon